LNTYGGLTNRPSYLTPDTGSTYSGVWSLDEHYEQRREGKFGGSNQGIDYLPTTIMHLIPGQDGDTNIIDGTGNFSFYNAIDYPLQGGEFRDYTTVMGISYSRGQIKYGPTSIKVPASASVTALYNDKLYLATGSWTIEYWEHRTSANVAAVITAFRLPGSYAGIMTGYYSAGTLYAYISTTGTGWFSGIGGASMGTSSLNTWQHYAVVRDTIAQKVYTFNNGILRANVAFANSNTIAWPYPNFSLCEVYPSDNASTVFIGYLEDFCISTRVKYTGSVGVGNSAFTPARITE